MNLNLGCGRNPIDGYVNLDRQALPGVDVVHDLERFPLPFDDDTFDEILGVDLIEHITDALGLMAELWRIAKPGCVCTFALPYGSSDDAWEDPTHVRPYFLNSWMYFAQPTYYRAQYDTMSSHDMLGNRLHPNALCPWALPGAPPPPPQGPADRPAHSSTTDETDPLHGSDVQSGPLRVEPVQGSLSATTRGQALGQADSDEEAERPSSILEGRLPLLHGACRNDGVRTPMGDGSTPGPSASSVGERPPRQWGSIKQFARELGTVVQATAEWSEGERLTELGRFVLSGGSRQTPEIGEDGCLCSTADYGYRGDWQIDKIVLDTQAEGTAQEVQAMVMSMRNIVQRQVVELRAVKPAREPVQALWENPQIMFNRR